jgi:hypothetical protein
VVQVAADPLQLLLAIYRLRLCASMIAAVGSGALPIRAL